MIDNPDRARGNRVLASFELVRRTSDHLDPGHSEWIAAISMDG